MGGLGWVNPLPAWLGSDPTPTEKVYAALKSMSGKGGVGPDNGLRDLWLQAKAQVIATSLEAVERPLLQLFPKHAIDHLEVWELLLGIPRAPTLEARQANYEEALASTLDATIAGARAALQKIDPNFDVESISFADASHVHHGKAFGPLPGVSGSPYGTGVTSRKSSGFPNYSDAFIVRVRYFFPPGVVDVAQTTLYAAELRLNELLPAWIDFDIYAQSEGPEGAGFYFDGGPLDDSYLDLTGL